VSARKFAPEGPQNRFIKRILKKGLQKAYEPDIMKKGYMTQNAKKGKTTFPGLDEVNGGSGWTGAGIRGAPFGKFFLLWL
jgi:hypothetical protein